MCYCCSSSTDSAQWQTRSEYSALGWCVCLQLTDNSDASSICRRRRKHLQWTRRSQKHYVRLSRLFWLQCSSHDEKLTCMSRNFAPVANSSSSRHDYWLLSSSPAVMRLATVGLPYTQPYIHDRHTDATCHAWQMSSDIFVNENKNKNENYYASLTRTRTGTKNFCRTRTK